MVHFFKIKVNTVLYFRYFLWCNLSGGIISLFVVSHIMIVLLHFIHSALLCVLFSRLCLISYHRRISYPHNQTICLFLASKDLTWRMVEEGSFYFHKNVRREHSKQSCSVRECFCFHENVCFRVSSRTSPQAPWHSTCTVCTRSQKTKSVYQITVAVFRQNFKNPSRPEKTKQIF